MSRITDENGALAKSMDQAFDEQSSNCEAPEVSEYDVKYSNQAFGVISYVAEDLAAMSSSLSQQSDYNDPWQDQQLQQMTLDHDPWQDQQLRQVALDHAVRMASMGNGDVVATAEAYYAFLKGDAAK